MIKLDISRFGFFSRGCTVADLKIEGKTPEDKDLLNIVKMSGDKNVEASFKNLEGRASAGEEEDFMLLIIFKRTGWETRERELRV